jgi:uncharacterized protein (TIGR02285 family)
MRRRRLGLLVAALLHGAAAAATPQVTWVTADLSTDTNKLGDHYLSFMMGRLPGFDHRVLRASVGRVWHEMRFRSSACVFNALKTPERQEFAVFSRRPLMNPGYRLYVAPSRRDILAPYLDSEGRVDLGKLADSPLRGGITANRVYNPVIEGFIATLRKSRPLDSLVSTRQLFNLLRSGRLDFTFAAPVDLVSGEDTLVGVPIAGGDSWSPTFVACTKDRTGQAVIAALDKVFEDQENWAEFIEPLRTVLSPEDFQRALKSAL